MNLKTDKLMWKWKTPKHVWFRLSTALEYGCVIYRQPNGQNIVGTHSNVKTLDWGEYIGEAIGPILVIEPKTEHYKLMKLCSFDPEIFEFLANIH